MPDPEPTDPLKADPTRPLPSGMMPADAIELVRLVDSYGGDPVIREVAAEYRRRAALLARYGNTYGDRLCRGKADRLEAALPASPGPSPADATPAPTPAPPCDNPACATPDVVRAGGWYRCLACGGAVAVPPPGPERLVTDHEEID